MPDPGTRWSEHLRERLASLSLSPAREVEIIEELSQHLDERYDDLRADGVTDAEAKSQALAELLDKEALADQMRSLRQAHEPPELAPGAPARSIVGDLWQDIRYTARALVKQRAFAAAAILTLALGIGATTAIFSVVNGVLIKPLPYPDPDALVRIAHTIGGIHQPYFSDQIYLTYVRNTHAFQALLLGIAGVYAVIAYAVSQRRREIGIRIALGAQASDIRRLFMRRGLTLGIIGLAVGLGGALAFTHWMESLVFGISVRDPLTFAAMPFLLVAAAVLASYLPARRAVAIDPVETMRAE